ncbi:MAG: hypothetical protein ACXWWC_01320 [Chitinophagaceae bacterium]
MNWQKNETAASQASALVLFLDFDGADVRRGNENLTGLSNLI